MCSVLFLLSVRCLWLEVHSRHHFLISNLNVVDGAPDLVSPRHRCKWCHWSDACKLYVSCEWQLENFPLQAWRTSWQISDLLKFAASVTFKQIKALEPETSHDARFISLKTLEDLSKLYTWSLLRGPWTERDYCIPICVADLYTLENTERNIGTVVKKDFSTTLRF